MRMHLVLTGEIAERLSQHQATTGASASAVIRMALDAYLPREGESYHQWVRLRDQIAQTAARPGERSTDRGEVGQYADPLRALCSEELDNGPCCELATLRDATGRPFCDECYRLRCRCVS